MFSDKKPQILSGLILSVFKSLAGIIFAVAVIVDKVYKHKYKRLVCRRKSYGYQG